MRRRKSQRGALGAQLAHHRADRVLARRSARNVRVGTIDGEVSLVELADGVAVIPEELAALLHVSLGLFDLTLGQQLVHVDALSNPLGGAGLGNGNFTCCKTYTIDVAPFVVPIIRTGIDPIDAPNVDFTVIFSESVTGVDMADFSLTVTGITGASVTGVSGSGVTFTVSASTGSSSGTLWLDVTDNDCILDTFSTPLGGIGMDNGNFTNNETYTVSK